MSFISTSTAKTGDTIRVHYTGIFQDGQVFDSSREREPLQMTLGQNQVIPGFEQALTGMSAGQSKSVTIPASEAYGQRDNDRVFQVSREQLPSEINERISIGEKLQVEQPDGDSIAVLVTELSDDVVTLDANHPLAGFDLTFELELVEIV